MKTIRKACVQAVFDALAEHGDTLRPQYAEQWDEIDANRFLCHITGRNCIFSRNCYVCPSCLRFICFFFVSASTYSHRHTDA